MIEETGTEISRTDLLPANFGMKPRTRTAFWNVHSLSSDSRLAPAEIEMLR